MPAGAVDADHPKQVEREILRMDVRCQRAIDAHAHVARAALADRLRREHMFDFRGSDPEGERTESAVRRGVAVAADDRHPGLQTSLLGSDDMDDAAARIAHREIPDPETTREIGRTHVYTPVTNQQL